MMKWKEWLLLGSLLFNSFTIKAQEAEEYPEYWQEELEKRINATTKIDWNYWETWEFNVEGGPWVVLDDIALKINKIYLDSLIDPLPPDDVQGKESIRYYLVINVSVRALNGIKTIDPAGSFLIKDENGRKIWTGDYEGRDVNGFPRSGRRVSMYEKLNPGKLKLIYPYSPPSDEITIGAAREFAVSRKIPFAIGENEVYGNGRRIALYLKNNIWLCYGRSSIPLINLENLGLREGYYEIKRELTEKEIFALAMNYILGMVIAEKPDKAVSYKQLSDISFRSIERRDSEIDSVTHYLKAIIPVSDNLYKIILSNYSHYYDSFSEDSVLVYINEGNVQNIKVFTEDGLLDLKEALKNF